MFGYIYQVTNTLNHKTYIGKRKGSFDPSYLGSGKIIKQSVKKNGKSNFRLKLIEECHSLEQLNEREMHYIAKFSPEYNIAKGGDGGCTGNHFRRGKKFPYKSKGSKVTDDGSPWIDKTCACCGKLFKVYVRQRHQEYCSKSCAAKKQMDHKEATLYNIKIKGMEEVMDTLKNFSKISSIPFSTLHWCHLNNKSSPKWNIEYVT